MVGRKKQIAVMTNLVIKQQSSFLIVTGRRRIGKTYLIDHVYQSLFCFKMTGIQNGDQKTQLINFYHQLASYAQYPISIPPSNWQEAFLQFKTYLQSLPKNKKHVIFIDELPWIHTAKSGCIQLLAHLWNDYISKEKHFILVICGSSTSWITKKIQNDKGGFHNRITDIIRLQAFTLSETKEFLESKKIKLTPTAISELYMAMGGVPFYLENIHKGETPSVTIDRMCFQKDGILSHEYENLYKALFDYPENHEAIIAALSKAPNGLTRNEILIKSKVPKGGPYNRAMNDLLLSGFISEAPSFGKRKRGTIYRVIDEYSVFYHKFIAPNRRYAKGQWAQLATSQAYKIWTGYAFESLCLKHIDKIKHALGITGVYTQTYSLKKISTTNQEGYQIDLIIDRKDGGINLCECKFYTGPISIDNKYAQQILYRKQNFITTTRTRKSVFNTLITNHPIRPNEYSLEAFDNFITIDALFQ